ncbi:MAG: HpaII family restriction endonuclease [Streptobacillus sp.]
MDKIYKTIDLFAGIGGIRKGYENTGRFQNVLSAEIDKYACEAYKFLYGDDPYNDVTSEEFKDLVKGTEYDVLLGGFPCQAFSIAGLKEGFEDETRGTLFFDIAKIIDISKPKAFMLENVEGLLKHDKGNTFNIIVKTLDELGYIVVGVDTEETLVGKKYSAKRENIVRTPYDFGIPQRRARVFIMGFRKEIVPKGYIFPMLPKGRVLNIYKDLNDLIEEVVEPKYYLSQTYLDTLNRHKDRHKTNKAGFGYIVVNDEPNPIANTIMATGGSGKERNLIRQFKEDYVGLKNIGAKKGELNSEGIRYMTPKEWGKLQGFVNYAFIENGIDKFELPKSISNTQQYKLFGNSVCIPVIESMAEYMIERLDDFFVKEKKMGFNKGEWSELYAIFYLLANRKLNLVDCKLNLIDNNIFFVESIISKKKNGVIKFDIQNDIVIPEIFGEKIEPIKIEEIIKFKEQVFYNIITGSDGSGSFEIDYVNQWLEQHNILTKFKAKAGVKEDIFLLNLDFNRNQKIELGYSIKSQLGSPATILNASDHTNIRYKIIGLNDEQINEINSINTRNKLKDRILKIYEYGGKIYFDKVVSECFDRNLRMIDTALPEALSEVLLNSYTSGNKELKELFKTSNIYTSESLAYKKLEDFLMSVSFGMFPSKEWNGKYSVKGGIIVVSKDSEVYVIDMVYYENEVKEFLINETKLDSPSSSRYDMLHLRKENGKVYFTLNLQVRYKN